MGSSGLSPNAYQPAVRAGSLEASDPVAGTTTLDPINVVLMLCAFERFDVLGRLAEMSPRVAAIVTGAGGLEFMKARGREARERAARGEREPLSAQGQRRLNMFGETPASGSACVEHMQARRTRGLLAGRSPQIRQRGRGRRTRACRPPARRTGGRSSPSDGSDSSEPGEARLHVPPKSTRQPRVPSCRSRPGSARVGEHDARVYARCQTSCSSASPTCQTAIA